MHPRSLLLLREKKVSFQNPIKKLACSIPTWVVSGVRKALVNDSMGSVFRYNTSESLSGNGFSVAVDILEGYKGVSTFKLMKHIACGVIFWFFVSFFFVMIVENKENNLCMF